VISFSEADLDRVKEIVGECPFEVIGSVGGEKLVIDINDEQAVDVAVSDLEGAWSATLAKSLEN
jgi:hypothetical protein